MNKYYYFGNKFEGSCYARAILTAIYQKFNPNILIKLEYLFQNWGFYFDNKEIRGCQTAIETITDGIEIEIEYCSLTNEDLLSKKYAITAVIDSFYNTAGDHYKKLHHKHMCVPCSFEENSVYMIDPWWRFEGYIKKEEWINGRQNNLIKSEVYKVFYQPNIKISNIERFSVVLETIINDMNTTQNNAGYNGMYLFAEQIKNDYDLFELSPYLLNISLSRELFFYFLKSLSKDQSFYKEFYAELFTIVSKWKLIFRSMYKLFILKKYEYTKINAISNDLKILIGKEKKFLERLKKKFQNNKEVII
ncbi:hypothetical protein [Bacillus velezensis]|uniref:hypothetical protein n=1 Tax=Bacillus velezensis TaxID=492670 RepID=UPI0039B03281